MKNNLRFLAPYFRGFPLIVLAMVVCLIIASKYLSYVTPMFESTAKLRLADIGEGIPNSNLYKDLDVFATSNKIAAEIEIMKSDTIVGSMLDRLNMGLQIFRVGNIRTTELFNNSPIKISFIGDSSCFLDKTIDFNIGESNKVQVAYAGQNFQGVFNSLISVANCFVLFSLDTTIIDSKQNIDIKGNYQFKLRSRNNLIKEIGKNLDIIAMEDDVPVIRISYKSPIPAKAAIIPNELAKTYISDYLKSKYNAANITVKFLNERIQFVGDQLRKSEEAILKYRNQNKITNIRQETETDLRKVSQLKIQQTNLKMSLDALKQIEQYVNEGKEDFLSLAPNFEAFTDLLSTEIIKKIKELQAEKHDLLLTYTPDADLVQVVDKKLADLTSYLLESISNTRKNLATKYDRLTEEINESVKVFIEVPEKEKNLIILNREFEIFQQTYNFLTEKKIEAEIAQSANISFHRIITPAKVSKKPVSPNRAIIKIVSIILGMFGAIFLIFIVHALKARINYRETIEENSITPIAAVIPKLKNKQEEDAYFLKMVSALEIKGLIKADMLICISGFKLIEGLEYSTIGLTTALGMQNRKVQIITAQPIAINNSNVEVTMVDRNTIKQLPKIDFAAYVHDLKNGFDITLILNDCFEEHLSTLFMDIADVNFIAVDSRLTPAKAVNAVDLLIEEYQLKNCHFILNREGYSPNVIKQLIRSFNTYRTRRAMRNVA